MTRERCGCGVQAVAAPWHGLHRECVRDVGSCIARLLHRADYSHTRYLSLRLHQDPHPSRSAHRHRIGPRGRVGGQVREKLYTQPPGTHVWHAGQMRQVLIDRHCLGLYNAVSTGCLIHLFQPRNSHIQRLAQTRSNAGFCVYSTIVNAQSNIICCFFLFACICRPPRHKALRLAQGQRRHYRPISGPRCRCCLAALASSRSCCRCRAARASASRSDSRMTQ